MIDLITNISSLISGVMVIVAFLGVLIKPIRKKIETWLRNTTNAEELTNTMKAHTKQLNNLEYKINQQETKSKKADEQIINHLKDVNQHSKTSTLLS
jgi:septal ring factor EnvC (AmiA/AmiB activator)